MQIEPIVLTGRRVILVSPVAVRVRSPWARAVRRRTREWRAALRHDPRLRPICATSHPDSTRFRSTIRAVIYADNGSNQPGAFVAVSVQVTITAGQAPGWIDFPFASPIALPAGRYWLGYWYGNSSAREYYDAASGGGRYRSAPYSSTSNPPASFGAASTSNNSYSIYATLG